MTSNRRSLRPIATTVAIIAYITLFATVLLHTQWGRAEVVAIMSLGTLALLAVIRE